MLYVVNRVTLILIRTGALYQNLSGLFVFSFIFLSMA